MKKKILVIMLLITLSFINAGNVSAKETYYLNDNNVAFSKDEYDFLSNMFWDGCQDLFTVNNYDKFISSNIMNGIINVATNNKIMPLGTLFEGGGRTLKIATSCNSNCFVSVTLTWNGSLTIRSYDVMGAYLENTLLLTSPLTTVTNSSDTTLRKLYNGFGVSLKLPSNGNNIIVNQNFRVSKGGHVYASYQHAKSSISLANSKNYTLSKSGYGRVFKFSGIAVNVYDQMSGVDIAV